MVEVLYIMQRVVVRLLVTFPFKKQYSCELAQTTDKSNTSLLHNSTHEIRQFTNRDCGPGLKVNI